MAPTALTATSRYIPIGTRRYYWVPTMADYTSPTRAELDAGMDLTAEVSAVSGFAVTSDTVDTPDFSTRFTSKIPGMITADDSSLTLYNSSDSDDARTLLVRDAVGNVVILPEGDNTDATMDVFPVKVASAPKSQEGDSPATTEYQFTITREPAADIPVPAAV